MAEREPLVQVENLSKHFKVGKSVLRAVDNVSLTIYRGETLGLVGECGWVIPAAARPPLAARSFSSISPPPEPLSLTGKTSAA